MPKIQILPEEIRSKIAAGEIVERPASVVKELIENAFDAQATSIKINFKEGGIKEISVYDDGEGIEPEDLKICYKHFATSKIKKLQDIFRIVTFGFRGEALASISQVSKLTIISKYQTSASAYEVKVEFGKEILFRPSYLNKGTLVKVENLFANLPARKAFLKSSRTETFKIMEIIKGISLCHPEIRYEVKSLDESGKEKTLFFWEGGNTKELISYITGIEESLFEETIFENPPYTFTLILTNTSKTFSHAKYLYILVNNRWIKDDKLSKTILSILKNYYGNLGFPAGIILIKAPYHLIDVNVHPAKWEVRFRDEKAIFTSLDKALEKMFEKRKIYYQKEEVFSYTLKEDIPLKEDFSSYTFSIKAPLISSNFKKPSYKYLGTFLNTYILVEIEKDLYVIDQHALSERIIFEELKSKLAKSISQKLIIPLLLNISNSGMLNFEEKREVLKNLGFEIEKLKNNQIILKSIPSILKEDVKDVIESILEEPISDPEKIRLEILKKYACLLARKKGDIISEEEIHFLLEKFLKENLQTCPHGRPLYFKLTGDEIEKRLRRK